MSNVSLANEKGLQTEIQVNQYPEEKLDAVEDDFHNISKLNTGILCYFVLLL